MSTNPSSAPDPFGMWRDWLSQSERQWNEFFNEMMGTDEFGHAMGKFMDSYLTAQRNFSEAFGRYFSAMNMPTRTDVLTLGNRLVEIEERLTSIESLLQAMGPEAKPEAAPPRPRPPRTKKPPAD